MINDVLKSVALKNPFNLTLSKFLETTENRVGLCLRSGTPSPEFK
jgi:hypothetical protein